MIVVDPRAAAGIRLVLRSVLSMRCQSLAWSGHLCRHVFVYSPFFSWSALSGVVFLFLGIFRDGRRGFRGGLSFASAERWGWDGICNDGEGGLPPQRQLLCGLLRPDLVL